MRSGSSSGIPLLLSIAACLAGSPSNASDTGAPRDDSPTTDVETDRPCSPVLDGEPTVFPRLFPDPPAGWTTGELRMNQGGGVLAAKWSARQYYVSPATERQVVVELALDHPIADMILPPAPPGSNGPPSDRWVSDLPSVSTSAGAVRWIRLDHRLVVIVSTNGQPNLVDPFVSRLRLGPLKGRLAELGPETFVVTIRGVLSARTPSH